MNASQVYETIPAWPELPAPADWQDALDTVHLWTQIVGKVRLTHMPWINHAWHVTLYLNGRGLTTSFIPHHTGGFEIEFDLTGHRLNIRTSNGDLRSFRLRPMTVADFYHRVMNNLEQLGIETKIYPKPVEIPDPILPFPEDETHAGYSPDAVQDFWRALTCIQPVFTRFRAGFIGKASPVHFFWGSFDLAVTLFSGRTAPKHPGGVPNCADWVMEECYSHELYNAGFWPGTGLGEPAFFSYAWPAPEGFEAGPVQPDATYFHEDLGEFILPYEAVQQSANPGETLYAFLESTYAAAAEKGGWDRKALEKRNR